MSALTRRQLFSRTILAGAGATVVQELGVFDPAKAATNPDYDPEFLMGQVVKSDPDTGVFQVVDLDQQVRRAQLIPASRVWKQGLWQTAPPALNDCVMSRGKLDPRNTLLIRQLFVDIRNVRGQLSSVSSSSVSLAQSTGAVITARVTGRTEVLVRGGKTTGATAGLAEGQYVLLIGHGEPSAGALTATRIIGPGPDTPDPEPVAVRASAGNTDPEYDRLTSWFCCGNRSSACGANCSGSGSGSCGDCRADYRQMAWPNLSTTNCNYTCGHSCNNCCRSTVSRACGYRPYVWNPCRNATVYTPKVVDCGPCIHCTTSDCSRVAVSFDVTPCLFTALGAPLSQGIQAINVNAV